MAMGDANLAANLSGFRVLVADVSRMKKADYQIQANLQRDISWLNPAHEDNYYIAAAILPWEGETIISDYVLSRASKARPFDWQPLFYEGFGWYFFRKNPTRGAEIILRAVPRARDVQDQWALQNVAALWIEKGYRTDEAARRVEAMAKSSPRGGFQKYLAVRAERLRDLEKLQQLAERFERHSAKRLTSLDELVKAGLISELPTDPLGMGFSVDAEGRPMFAPDAKAQNQ